MNTRIAALALTFTVLIVPAAGAQEAAKPADSPPADATSASPPAAQPTATASTTAEDSTKDKKKTQVRCDLPTGSIIRKRANGCASNASAQSDSTRAQDRRSLQIQMDMMKQKNLGH